MTDGTGAHVLQLPGGDFRIWRSICLRGTGFPSSFVLRLAHRGAAEAAERRLDREEDAKIVVERAFDALRAYPPEGEGAVARARQLRKQLAKQKRVPEIGNAADVAIREANRSLEALAAADASFAEAYSASAEAASSALRELARDPLLREAVTWQNRAAIQSAFEPLLRRATAGASRSGDDRRNESLIARYLQRYCTKNDTIGFFGPIGWATWATEGPPITVARDSGELLSHRAVYFEQWPIDAIAAKLSEDARLHPWMVPRRLPFVRIEADVVHSEASGKHPLAPPERALLDACDGERTARAIASGLAGLYRDEEAVIAALRDLHEKKLVAFSFELPLVWNPDLALRELLARIDDDELRREASRPLDLLDAGRTRVAAAAGDAEALQTALADLETIFGEVTGGARATRQHGSMYAARQLVFEDCRRAIEMTLGPAILESLGAPLSLVLQSARWLTFEIARVFREKLRALFDELVNVKGTRNVPFMDFWRRSQRILFGAKDAIVGRAVEELQVRWTRVLAPAADARRVSFEPDELRERVAEAFAAPGPGWNAARHHSPDILIAAKSAEEIAAGRFLLVLGEIHPALNALDTSALIAQHPDPSALYAAEAADLPSPRIVPPPPKDWPGNTVRTSSPFVTPNTWLLETGFDPVSLGRERVVRLSDLKLVEGNGSLYVSGPDLPAIEIVDFFGEALAVVVSPAFRMLPKSAHTPRVTIGRLVVSRESWTLAPDELEFAFAADERTRFLEARRWARRIGIPRFVFAKSTIEVKPVYVDLDCSLFVEMLAKLARAARDHAGGDATIVMTEMIPALDESWLPSAGGARHTSEFRIVAVDVGSERG